MTVLLSAYGLTTTQYLGKDVSEANKFKRKWTRLCFCDIMVTEMRKRWWIRPTLGCVICNDRKAGSWYRIKGCLNWCVCACLNAA